MKENNTPTGAQLAYELVVDALGEASTDMAPLSPDEVLELLWPLNDVFRPELASIQATPYDRAYEPMADEAIRALSENTSSMTWRNLQLPTWRVLLERHMQMLQVAAANKAAETKTLMSVPRQASKELRFRIAILLWLYEMELPFPVRDRSQNELPPAPRETRHRRH